MWTIELLIEGGILSLLYKIFVNYTVWNVVLDILLNNVTYIMWNNDILVVKYWIGWEWNIEYMVWDIVNYMGWNTELLDEIKQIKYWEWNIR